MLNTAACAKHPSMLSPTRGCIVSKRDATRCSVRTANRFSAHRESPERNPTVQNTSPNSLALETKPNPKRLTCSLPPLQPSNPNQLSRSQPSPAATNPSSTCSCHEPPGPNRGRRLTSTRSIGSSNPTDANPKLRAVPTELSTAGGSADGWKPLPSPNHGQPLDGRCSNVQELERARACAAVGVLVRRSHLPIVAGVCVLWVDGPVPVRRCRRGCEHMVRHRCRCGCCVYDPASKLANSTPSRHRRLRVVDSVGCVSSLHRADGSLVLGRATESTTSKQVRSLMMVLGPEASPKASSSSGVSDRRCSHIGKASGTPVHHEARVTCLEENRQSTLEVAQKEIATPKACPPTGKELMLQVEYTREYSIAW